MMVASYNPNNEAVSFISIPRDLYVNLGTGFGAGRINSYVNAMLNDGESLTGALASLTNKVSDIMGVPIDHYVLVDFE